MNLNTQVNDITARVSGRGDIVITEADELIVRDVSTAEGSITVEAGGMINAERLSMMRDKVTLLNFARKGIIDDEAVCAAIETGKVHAYVCDFPSNLLRNHERVIALPHLGASTTEAEDNCAVMVADQVSDYLENGNIKNSVNFPEVSMPRAEGVRLSVVNANVPNMVGQISTCLGEHGINIIDMVNMSKRDLAYTLVDVNEEPGAEVIAQIGAIEGVLAARVV